jgi:hypothetical protein
MPSPQAMPKKKAYSFAVAVFASSIILLEILLTRIFSVMLFAHFAFVAVSVGMLGIAAAGISIYVKPLPNDNDKDALNRQLATSALLFTLTTVVAIMFCIKTGTSLSFEGRSIFFVSMNYLVTFFPFYFGGKVLGLIFTYERSRFAKLYAIDLISAAVSCIIYSYLIRLLGGPSAILFVALIAGVTGLICFPSTRPIRIAASLSCALTAVLLILDLSLGILTPTTAKGHRNNAILFEGWNTFSRVAVYDQKVGPWALSPLYTGPINLGYLMDIDASASTMVTPKGDNQYLTHELTAAAYSMAHPQRCLIIGSGGGRDIATALQFGMNHVDAVEINPLIVNKVMRSQFAPFNGYIYDDARVHPYIEDGRTFIRQTRDSYDLIQLSLVDTWAATAAGAFALSENNLYTVEALQDYVGHLNRNGILTLVRWSGDDADRLIGILYQASQNLNIENFSKHLVVLEGPSSAQKDIRVDNVIFRKSEFDDAGLAVLETWAKENGFNLTYDPRIKTKTAIEKFVLASHPLEELERDSDNEVRPTTDDWPFFFFRPAKHYLEVIQVDPRLLFTRGEYLVVEIFILSFLIGIIAIFLPLFMHSRVKDASMGRRGISSMVYFACIGIGFMFVEMSLMQRSVLYLGHPSHALATILSGLLLGTGCGSWAVASTKFFADKNGATLALITGIVIVAFNPCQIWLYNKTQGMPAPIKIVFAELLLIPLGFFLGTLMPTGINAITRTAPQWVPWAWGINGLASVLGSTAAVISAMSIGFYYTLVLGAVAYILASITARFLPHAVDFQQDMPSGEVNSQGGHCVEFAEPPRSHLEC